MKRTNTFSQSVQELANTLEGMTWTHSQLLLQAQDYLRKTGTKRPSPSMVGQLARGVSDELAARSRESAVR